MYAGGYMTRSSEEFLASIGQTIPRPPKKANDGLITLEECMPGEAITVDKVKEIKSALLRENEIGEKLAEFSARITALHKECGELSTELNMLRVARLNLMARMDLSSPGNHGYKERMTEFLSLLVRLENV